MRKRHPNTVTAPTYPDQDSEALTPQADRAWNAAWTRFFRPTTSLFYDYLSSYEPGRELDHLPTPEEIARQFPNPCGYSTGMEDCAILGGVMLSAIVDRFAATGDEDLRTDANRVFEGLRLCATIHGVPGFVARGVSPADGRSVYIDTSRDQITHAVHGLWRLYHSPLSDDTTRNGIREILSAVADRMIRNVTPENDHDYLRADGKPCPLGICRMWNVQAHETARLPMVYATAWDVTREDRFAEHLRRTLAPAIEKSRGVRGETHHAAYVYLQVQCSLEVLAGVAEDRTIQERIREIRRDAAQLARARAEEATESLRSLDLTAIGPDWRTVSEWKNQSGYPNPQWGAYRRVWHAIRESGEAPLAAMTAAPDDIDASMAAPLRQTMQNTDYNHISSCGIVHHIAAWWKARALGLSQPASQTPRQEGTSP